MTPNGEKYSGLAFQKGSCGVSIIRSGEAMEQGLRDCCRSIRIGKILIQVKWELKNILYCILRIRMSLQMKQW